MAQLCPLDLTLDHSGAPHTQQIRNTLKFNRIYYAEGSRGCFDYHVQRSYKHDFHRLNCLLLLLGSL